MIKVKNLKKSFNNKPILKGISCEFEKGKTSLIIGQTGSGKTVFLKCLLGPAPWAYTKERTQAARWIR